MVHSDPAILSGTPVFVGTRVPVQSLFDYLEGGDTLDEFLRQFPSVTREQAIAALELARESVVASALLLDENIPHDLIPQFAGHDVSNYPGPRLGRYHEW